MFFAGIDWADDHHDVVILSPTGSLEAGFRVTHSLAGLKELIIRLRGLTGRPEDVAFIIETRHGLLVTTLLEAGFPVYPVNPKR